MSSPDINEAEKCPSPPFVTVAGVPNFRDVGGKDIISRAASGDEHEGRRDPSRRSVRSGYLYRCAQPTHITASGRATLTSDLGVKDTFDLRSFKELRLMRTRYPDVPLDTPGVERHHVPIYMDEDYTPISLAKKYDLGGPLSSDDPGQTTEGYIAAYSDILTQAAKSGAFRTILLHILRHPDRPLAVHCTAGKDRTGIFAALVLSLCGVSTRDIVADSAHTTYGLGKWREHLIKRLMEGAGEEYKNVGKGEEARRPTREEAERIVASRPEQMEGFLDQVLEGEFGGAGKYLRKWCRFTDEEVEGIVRNLTVEER